METPTLRLLAVRILSQTVSSSPCERNWSTFSLIHTQRRNRLGYEKLKKMVYCHYNMRLRERILRDENKEPDDPLDLMMIGQHAHLEEEDNREDPLYEWLRSEDLDTQNGEPMEAVAQEVVAQGVDVEDVLHRERTPEEAFDPLLRSQTQSTARGVSQMSQQALSTSSSSRTKSGDDDATIGGSGDDGGDDGGGGGGIGGDGSHVQSQRPFSPFTGEEHYTHATQDEDHGARPPIKRYERRSGTRKGNDPAEDNTLTHSMASVDLSSSTEDPSYGWSENSGWSYGSSQPHPLPYEWHTPSDYHPDSGVQSRAAYTVFTFPYPYVYEPPAEQYDDEVDAPPRHSTWY